MTPEIAKKWAKALRSGEYQQTKFYLELEGSYCCLGVLSKINNWTLGEPSKQTGEERLAYPETVGAMSQSEEEYFMELNDSLHCSFAEIADEVEKMYFSDAVST